MIRFRVIALALALLATACGGASPAPTEPPTPDVSIIEDLGGTGARDRPILPTRDPALGWVEPDAFLTTENAAQITNTGILQPVAPLSTTFSYSFSTDGTRLVTLNDGYIFGWDLITGDMMFSNTRQQAISVYYSPDKTEVYAVTERGEGLVFGADRGQLRTTFRAHPDFANVSAFAPFDGWLAVGGRDGSVRVWDTLERASLVTFNAHTGDVTQLAFSDDGRYLLTGGGDQRVMVWDWREREAVHIIENGGAVVNAVFSADGQFVAAGAPEFASVWQISPAGGIYQYTIQTGAGGTEVLAFSPDGRYLVTGGSTPDMAVWRASDGEMIALLPGFGGIRASVAFNPAGDLMLASVLGGAVTLFDIESLSETAIRAAQLAPADRVARAAFSPDGFTLTFFEAAGPISVWGIPPPDAD